MTLGLNATNARVPAASLLSRNLWRNAAGELIVRPGLRRMIASTSNRAIIGGFSVFDASCGDVFHYLFDVSTAGTGGAGLRLIVVDENFVTHFTWSTGINVVPRVITHAVILDQLVIASPDFPTMWGIVGSHITWASPVASVTNQTAIDPVPRGICTPWVNRVVIVDGRNLFISDPISVTGGSPQTFVGANQNSRPAPIYGVHQGAGGLLVTCGVDGTYALPESAAAVGVVGLSGASWEKLNHYATTAYGTTCVSRGRVAGLTTRGIAHLDVHDPQETLLVDPSVSLYYENAMEALDMRSEATVVATDAGPAVSMRNDVCRIDLSRELVSWWSDSQNPTDFTVVGALKGISGEEYLVTKTGVYRVEGNYDAAASTSTAANGMMYGRIATQPSDSPTVRAVEFASAAYGANNMRAAVRGFAGATKTLPIEPSCATIGTSSWGGSWRWQNPPMRSAEIDFNINSDDVTIEVSANKCNARIDDSVNVLFSQMRPQSPNNR